ncbi:MAG: hypothetical protein ACR2JW_04385 [Thermomicrobiales bacterium]
MPLVGQMWPQEPQLLTSVEISTQMPVQMTNPVLQVMAQTPLVHVAAPFALGQR